MHTVHKKKLLKVPPKITILCIVCFSHTWQAREYFYTLVILYSVSVGYLTMASLFIVSACWLLVRDFLETLNRYYLKNFKWLSFNMVFELIAVLYYLQQWDLPPYIITPFRKAHFYTRFFY